MSRLCLSVEPSSYVPVVGVWIMVVTGRFEVKLV